MTPEELHKQELGVEPVIIGLHWDDVQERIMDAIEQGVPYNEENELAPQELEDFESGELVF